jgi:hypothetical protein
VPCTPLGILRQCNILEQQFERDAVGYELVSHARAIANGFVVELMAKHDDDHTNIGEIAFDIVMRVQEFLENRAIEQINANDLETVRGYFSFDTAEKLRELVNMHARRSRYLY